LFSLIFDEMYWEVINQNQFNSFSIMEAQSVSSYNSIYTYCNYYNNYKREKTFYAEQITITSNPNWSKSNLILTIIGALLY